MRTFGKILRMFFTSKRTQTWFCVPSIIKTKEDKKFIIDTINFLQKTIKIK